MSQTQNGFGQVKVIYTEGSAITLNLSQSWDQFMAAFLTTGFIMTSDLFINRMGVGRIERIAPQPALVSDNLRPINPGDSPYNQNPPAKTE